MSEQGSAEGQPQGSPEGSEQRPGGRSVESAPQGPLHGWRRYLPIAAWAPTYRRGWLRADVIAGLTVWALLVPEAMAYASLAGVPPETGLYAALIAPLVYLLLGTSRQLSVGPSSSIAVMSAAVVTPLAGGDPDRFVALTMALALVMGTILVLAGLLRLGFVTDFMSKPVLDGFIVGLALTIVVGQLPELFGVETEADGFLREIGELLGALDQVNGRTLAVGLVSLGLLFAIERWVPRLPAALTVTFASIIVVSATGLADRGVTVIGEIPSSLPEAALPTGLTLADVGDLVPGALGIAVVAFAESIAAARSYATRHGYEIDANQELVALGGSNLGAGLFGGFVVDGSLSRSEASNQAGQRSQLGSLVLGLAVLVTIGFLTPLFSNLAEATLAAVVIHAVWHLVSLRKVGRYRRVSRDDFLAGLVALLGVVLFDILAGLAIAVLLSLTLLLARVSRPNWSVLGRTRPDDPDDRSYQDVEHHPDAQTTPGLLVIRFDAPLFFGNSTVFKDIVLRSVDLSDPPPQVVLVDAEGITEVDATALAMLDELRTTLEERHVELWAARLHESARQAIERYDSLGDAQPGRYFPTIRAAVEAFADH